MSAKTIYSLGLLLLLSLFATSCGNFKQDKTKESATVGNITIAVDESLKPVMDQQIAVWDSSYPDGHVKVEYLPESACFEQLMKGKVKLIVTARDIDTLEKAKMKASKMYVASMAIASDAIAVIVNPASQDTVMTKGILTDIILGKFPRKYTVVLDNANSSLARYVADSLLQSDSIPNTHAVNTNEAVLDYVAKNTNAIGLIGVSHVYNPDTSGMGGFYKNIKVVAMRDDSTYKVYQPYQYAILYHYYPMTRNIYYVTSESYSDALASGFIGFLCNTQGQMIFKKSWMVPLRANLEVKEVEITR